MTAPWWLGTTDMSWAINHKKGKDNYFHYNGMQPVCRMVTEYISRCPMFLWSGVPSV
jgi:hypothetical protein